jgi:hypothetical protein
MFEDDDERVRVTGNQAEALRRDSPKIAPSPLTRGLEGKITTELHLLLM